MKTFWDAIRSSSGNSFVWETGGPMVMQGNYDPSFDIALHCKDNQLCYDIAKKHKVSTYKTNSNYTIIHNFSTVLFL
jgi:3-hydroxyisobutyrate dehydrogenase-like beta-hydroxyacid dehydrogenase